MTTCADLSLTVSDSPDPATVNASVTYLITVTNQGPDTAPDVEVVDILPGPVVLDSVTPSLGSCSGTGTIVCNLGDLANGASATVTIVVTPTSTGRLTNLTTVSAEVTDTNPSNDSVRQQTIVTLPDLLVRSVSAVTAVIPGSDIVVTETTTNRGKVAAGPSTTSFYLSMDRKPDAGDLLLGSRIPNIPALAPKESNTGSTSLTIPLATALGRYFLIAVADAAGGVDETKEKNAKVRPLTVALPDMIVQSLRAPSSAAAGASVVVSDTTGNKAPVGAGASTTQYYLSADVILDGSDVLLGSRIVPALGAKGRSAGSVSVTIPLATTSGKYFLLAVADEAAEVTEADENNNLRSRPITITP